MVAERQQTATLENTCKWTNASKTRKDLHQIDNAYCKHTDRNQIEKYIVNSRNEKWPL